MERAWTARRADFERGTGLRAHPPGFLRVATTEGYIRRLQHDVNLMQSLGFSGIDWIEQDAVRAMVDSRATWGALEAAPVLVDPAAWYGRRNPALRTG